MSRYIIRYAYEGTTFEFVTYTNTLEEANNEITFLLSLGLEYYTLIESKETVLEKWDRGVNFEQ